MFMKLQIHRTTWVFAIITVVGIVAGYTAVAANSYMRAPTVVVAFNIEKVVSDLTEKADSETKLRALVTKIKDEQERRVEAIDTLKAALESVSKADRELLVEDLEQKTLEAMSYQRFAAMQIDNEKSLMLRDIYMKIKKAVADIAQENGYDIVLISDMDRTVSINSKSEVPRELQVLERIGSQRAMFTSSQTDITEQIVTHMNLEWEKRTDG